MLGGWTLKGQWINLLLFLCSIFTVVVGPIQSWSQLGARFEPIPVIGYVGLIAAFLRSINTEKPRASYQERKTDLPQVMETAADHQAAQHG